MPPQKIIFEMPIYDGRLKEWRILNMSSNTFYSLSYPDADAAFADIQTGEIRANCKVIGIRRYHEIFDHLN